MFSLKNNLKFITINQDYLKYLHSFCSEVYYKPTGYETKPYIGILVQENNVEYVIPLPSAKEKHKTQKNVDVDRFLIFENCDKPKSGSKDIYIKNSDGSFKHILSVMDLKKNVESIKVNSKLRWQFTYQVLDRSPRRSYLSRHSRGLHITEAYTAGLLKNENYMWLRPPLILSVPNCT